MKAFEKGTDGILVAGCHFTEGNLLAKGRVGYTRKFLSETGLEEERIRMINISAAGARPLVDHIQEMLVLLKNLGPSPLRGVNPPTTAEMRI